MPRPVLDLVTARRWAMTARLMLGAAREQIDALNVFPVADGDTGTNMYLTLDGAIDYIRGQFELGAGTERLKDGMALISRGMLLAARGNSGIILSQLTRGLAEAVEPEVQEAGPHEVASAFEASARTAYDALAAPVEGTILSVARAAAQGARAAVDRGRPCAGDGQLDVAHVVAEALDAAREALARTPDQLPVLAASGVVDAGGAGLVLVIEALQTVLEDRPPGSGQELPEWWVAGTAAGGAGPPGSTAEGRQGQVPVRGGDAPDHQGASGDGPGATGGTGCGAVADEQDGSTGAVEVMYLLAGSDPERVALLRTNLAQVGTSVVVAGGPEEWRVHVHLDDPRLAVEAGSLAGQVTGVTLTSLVDGGAVPGQVAGPTPSAAAVAPTGLAVVACALGDGVCELFTGAGAVVVSSGPRARASAGQLLAAVFSTAAPRVVLLPNDADTVMVAHATALEAREHGVEVDVVATRSLVEGLAALAVLDPDGEPDQVVAGMRESAQAVMTGAVTRAERAAATPVGPCEPGQWLGIVGRDRILCVEDEVKPAAWLVVDALWHDDVEVVTVLLGQDADQAVRAAVTDALAEREAAGGRPYTPEVVVLRGDQPTYPVLLGIE